jgi:DNA (cytosine-5)-methyltransferase 1
MGADDFKITVPLNQALFGFGDAVCVPVISWIAKNYLNEVWRERFSSRQRKFNEKTKTKAYRRAAGT